MLWVIVQSKVVFSFLVNDVLPHRCIGCYKLTESSDDICAKCLYKFEFITKPYCHICGIKFVFDV